MIYFRSKLALPRIVQNQYIVISIRMLFSKKFLGIEDYKLQRSTQLPLDFEDLIIETEVGKLAKRLKHSIHGMSKEECKDEYPRIREILHSIHNSPAEMKGYAFGPSVMRMFHYLNMPNHALDIFYDDQMPNMFDNLNSKLNLLDLLFIHEKYNEMLEIIGNDNEKQKIRGKGLSPHLNCLAFAACYKLNTGDALTYALKLWNQSEKEHQLFESINFLSMLAINQGHPETAVNISGSTKKSYYVLVNVRLIALAECNHFSEATKLIEQRKENFPNYRIFASVVERIEESMKKFPTTEAKTNFAELLVKTQHPTSKITIDEMLCSTIEPHSKGVQQKFSSNYKTFRKIPVSRRNVPMD